VDLGVRGLGYVVFGGTRGMGLAAARALAADGATVAIVGRHAEPAAKAAASVGADHGARVVPLVGDLTVAGPAPRPGHRPLRTSLAAERGWPVEEALERAMVEDWSMRVALGRAGRPEELGDVIAFLLSERAGYLTGALVNVDGGTDF
jgi:NAD(P)-dependent dehydrogenase (short-subunit alcohol dehydrogenase family)